jgi:hypothetical protein
MSGGPRSLLATVGLLGALAACAGQPGPLAPAPRAPTVPPARFEIVAVGDTTFAFAAGSNRWLRPGATGIAVDPKRRDGLVARYRVLEVRDGLATALITGQTTRVTPDHMVLAVRPPVPLLRQRAFWLGTFAGGLVAGVAASSAW